MTLICGRHLLGLLLMLTFAQTTTGWWWRDLLLNDYLQPTIEYLVGQQLDAEVRIAGVQLSSNQLQLTGLHIVQQNVYRIEVAETDVRFTLGGLWRRQLESVRLHAPRVEILGVPESKDESSPGLPEQPPLEIAILKISDGTVVLLPGENHRKLYSINIDLYGTRRPRFEARARLGAGTGLPIALSGTANWDKRPGLTLTRFDWDGDALLEAPLQFQLDRSGTSVAGSARLPRLNRAALEKITTILALPVELPPELDFSFQDPEISLAINPAELDVQLTIPAATVQNGGQKLDLSALSVNLHRQDDIWTGKGRLTLEKSVQSTFNLAYIEPNLTGDFTCVVTDFGALAGRFAPEWKGQLVGGGMLKGKFSTENGKSLIRADFTGRRTLEARTDYRFDLSPLRAQLNAEITEKQVRGEGKFLLLGRELAVVSGTPDKVNVELKPMSLTDLVRLTGPDLLPKALDEIEQLSGSAELQRGPTGRWQGQAKLAASRINSAGIELTEMVSSSRFSQQKQGLSFEELRLSGQAATAAGNGQLSVTASGAVAGETFQVKLASLEANNIEFFSSDGMSGLVDGHLLASGKITGNLDSRLLGLSLAVRLGAAEVLHGSFYANLTDTDARLDLQGGINLETQQLTARTLSVEIPALVSAQVAGSASPDLINLSGSLNSGELGNIFTRYIKGNLETSAPGLKDLELRGTLSADFSLRQSADSLTVQGTLQPQDFGLKLASSDLEITGGSGILPLAFNQGQQTDQPPAPPSNGVLNFTSFKVGPAQLENAPLNLLSSTNRIEIKQFPSWNLAGGRISVTELVAAIEERQPTIAAHVRADGIDLKTLTRQLDMISMTGSLSADLGEIRYADKTLSSAGQATINAFGGTTIISNIRLRDPASRYRTLLGDIDFNGIDLYQLTRTFEFGEMNGILDGHIHRLRLFGTVPSQFEAELSTRDEGRRNISVKALNNLSILSQGGLSAALSRGIYRFIDFYRYQKIGLRCTLDNDIFRMQGTGREDSDDYLVYGGLLPPKIDIIAPSRDISFKEMLKRLSRIDRASR